MDNRDISDTLGRHIRQKPETLFFSSSSYGEAWSEALVGQLLRSRRDRVLACFCESSVWRRHLRVESAAAYRRQALLKTAYGRSSQSRDLSGCSEAPYRLVLALKRPKESLVEFSGCLLRPLFPHKLDTFDAVWEIQCFFGDQ